MFYDIAYVIIGLEVRNMEFSAFVKMAREKIGISQEELARAINVSFATINRWENSKTHPNKLARSVFLDYCKRQGIDINMLNGVEE